MTALGAAVYGGFFGLAALWLAATSPEKRADEDHSQAADRSNAASVAAGAAMSSPCCATQSSQK
ncbi:hypothetical protein C1Y40_04233 [Mycobacterium talmoniae]|uniref:Uncharacterized protein n=1 Tax=Mycobacterium talmoniae TaxID=1858794 RepID=A0A2S8BFY4_9MYCO|nr:hypothetical protein C1Y40_04233 [Mycobacterium talmoniae]